MGVNLSILNLNGGAMNIIRVQVKAPVVHLSLCSMHMFSYESERKVMIVRMLSGFNSTRPKVDFYTSLHKSDICALLYLFPHPPYFPFRPRI